MELNFAKWFFITIFLFLILIIYTKFIPLFQNTFYRNIKYVKNPEDIKVLVNKNHKLKKDYIPHNLVKLKLSYSLKEKYLKQEAALSLEELIQKANQLGYHLVVVSAYRSYAYQEHLYHQYVKEKGKEYADLCSARAGHSEHQTGLAFDIMGSNQDYNLFEQAKEFEWMSKNAYKYGFILRYPKGKETITGFKYEPWHYRYVGKETAKKIFLENSTLEEYTASLNLHK